MSAYFYW